MGLGLIIGLFREGVIVGLGLSSVRSRSGSDITLIAVPGAYNVASNLWRRYVHWPNL